MTKSTLKDYEMGRTKPVSVRFDPEKLNLVIKSESLESPQKAVDYLFDVYYWQHKLNPVTKNGPTTEYEAFEGQIKDANEVPALELVKWAVLRSESLTGMEKKVLMASVSDKISKLK